MEKVVLRVTIVVDKFNMPQYTYHYCPYLKQWWWFNDVGWLNNYLKNHLHHSTTVNIVTSIQNSNWLVFYGQECVIDLRNGQNWSMNLTLKSVILSKHWSVFLLKFSKQNVAFSTTATVYGVKRWAEPPKKNFSVIDPLTKWPKINFEVKCWFLRWLFGGFGG